MSFSDYARRTIPRSYNPPKAANKNRPFNVNTDLKPGMIFAPELQGLVNGIR